MRYMPITGAGRGMMRCSDSSEVPTDGTRTWNVIRTSSSGTAGTISSITGTSLGDMDLVSQFWMTYDDPRPRDGL